MNLTLILVVILIVAVIALFYSFVRSFFKTLKFVLVLAFIGLVIFSVMIFLDVNDFESKFQISPNLYLMTEGKVIAGYRQIMAEAIQPLGEEALTQYSADLATQNYSKILGDNFKLFIINRTAFNLSGLKLGEKNLTQEQLSGLLGSSHARKDYVAMIYPDMAEDHKQLMADNISRSDAEFRAIIFAGMLSQAMKDDPAFIFKRSGEGNAIIYPESIAFRFMKVVPLPLMQKLYKEEEKE